MVISNLRVTLFVVALSAINRLDADRRNRVLDELARIAVEEFDDRVVRNLVTAVYTARRGD